MEQDEITTIEGLAELIQCSMANKEDLKGMATKDDLKELATKADLQEVTGRLENLETKMEHLEASVTHMQLDMHELKQGVVYQHEYEDSLGRIKYMERKLGIESGKQKIDSF